jgi:MFS family permease
MPNTLALLRSAYSPEALTRAVGVWGSAAGAATAAGPILGGLLVDNVSWQSVFYLNVPVGLATLGLGIPYLLESRESHRAPIDWPGVLTLAGGLSALIFGLVKAPEWTWSGPRTLATLGLAVALLGGFLLVESRATAPLLPLWLFRDRSVSMGSLIVLLNFFALFGVLFFVSLYLQSVSGYRRSAQAFAPCHSPSSSPSAARWARGSPTAPDLGCRSPPACSRSPSPSCC